MARQDLLKLMVAVRESIERLSQSPLAEERTLARALAHLWSAHDELELLANERLGARVS